MKVVTKYNVGDEVWVMKDNRPQNFKVQGISLELVDGLYNGCMNFGIDVIKYDLGTRMSPLIYNECYLFPTKEELIKGI